MFSFCINDQCKTFQAKDLDQGANGEVRYQILGQEEAKKFAVDPITGQIRSVASFVRDAGRVFGFDVKAVDRNGAEDGRSAIANVFVSITMPKFTFIREYFPSLCRKNDNEYTLTSPLYDINKHCNNKTCAIAL